MGVILTVPARVPIGRDAEGRPVFIERAWLDFINEQLFSRVGGSVAPTNSELVVDMHDDAGLEELKAETFKALDGLMSLQPPQPVNALDDTAPPGAFFMPDAPQDGRIQALEAEVAQLRSLVEGLLMGNQQ